MVLTNTEWTRNAVRKLISLYKENPSLYDMKNSSYYKKPVRNKTLTEIAQKLESERAGTTIDDVLKKVQTLRTQFGQELNKSRKSAASTNLSEEAYEPTVWWYKDLSFLKKFIKPRKDDHLAYAINESESQKEDVEDEEENDEFLETTEVIKNERKRKLSEKETAEVFIEDFMLNEISDNNEVTVYEIQNSAPAKMPKVDSKTVQIIQTSPSTPGFFPATHSQIRTTDTSDRNQELAKFVASQMTLIKDDYLFYHTQHEILSIVNKAQLNQLLKDKGIEPKL